MGVTRSWRLGGGYKRVAEGIRTPAPTSTTNSNGNDLAEAASTGGAESGASGPQPTQFDPDLAAIIQAWPRLTDAQRKTLMSVVSEVG